MLQLEIASIAFTIMARKTESGKADCGSSRSVSPPKKVENDNAKLRSSKPTAPPGMPKPELGESVVGKRVREDLQKVRLPQDPRGRPEMQSRASQKKSDQRGSSSRRSARSPPRKGSGSRVR